MGERSFKNPQNTLQIFLSLKFGVLFSLLGKRIEKSIKIRHAPHFDDALFT